MRLRAGRRGSACWLCPLRARAAQAVAEQGSDTRFIAGSAGLWILWVVVALLMVLMLGVLVIVVTGGMTSGGRALSALLVALVALPLAWRSLRKGGTKPFDPQTPRPNLWAIGADGPPAERAAAGFSVQSRLLRAPPTALDRRSRPAPGGDGVSWLKEPTLPLSRGFDPPGANQSIIWPDQYCYIGTT
jgi:hypothetical protein